MIVLDHHHGNRKERYPGYLAQALSSVFYSVAVNEREPSIERGGIERKGDIHLNPTGEYRGKLALSLQLFDTRLLSDYPCRRAIVNNMENYFFNHGEYDTRYPTARFFPSSDPLQSHVAFLLIL